ncbi:hypothetical protein ACFLQ7_02395 [Actinomycetota bacterium]
MGVAMKCMVLVASTVLVLISSGCASDTGSDESPEYTEITFDGATCSVPDPDRLPQGGHAFVLTNNSQYPSAWLFVGSITDGHDYQDLVDAQSDAGGPPNSPQTHMDWFPHEIASFDPADTPDIELDSNQTLYPIVLTPGLDAVGIATSPPSPLLWLCGPLDVTGT